MATKTKTTMACLMRVLGPSGRLVARDASRTTSPLPTMACLMRVLGPSGRLVARDASRSASPLPTMACLMQVLGPSGRLVARDASRTTSPLPKRVSTVVTATTTTTTATTATTTTTAPSTSGSSSPLATLASDLTATLPSSSSTSATASSSSPTTTTRSASTTTNAATTYPVPELNGAQHPSIVRLKQAIAKLKSMPAVFEAASSLSSWASADLARFRSPSYGAGQDSQTRTKNLDFYCNRIPSQPNGDLIDAIHSTWLHKHALLEEHHGYIQWLFPLHEAGVNGLAQVLQRPELEQMRRDPKIRIRVQRSFELMLDFYGFVLEDPKTGMLKRSSDYKFRFGNLTTYTHNFLRITRILKFLGLMGMTHYQTGFLAALLEEVICHGTLRSTTSSLQSYWLPTLLDDAARTALEDIVAAASADDTSKTRGGGLWSSMWGSHKF